MTASIAALFAQAQQLHQQGHPAEAERLCRDLLQRQPAHDAEARHGLSLLRAQQGAYAEAVRLFQEAIAGNPRQPYFYVNLGEARRRLGELDLAIAACRQALALQTELPEAHYNLANGYREQGQLDLAVSHYQQAVRCKPNYAQAWYNLGNARRQQGRYRRTRLPRRIWNPPNPASRPANRLRPHSPIAGTPPPPPPPGT